MEMSDEKMVQLLRNLEETEYWGAILRYTQIRLSQSQQAVLSGDPFKDPTVIARNQGVMLGLSDLQNAVIQLITPDPEAEEEEKKAKKDEGGGK